MTHPAGSIARFIAAAGLASCLALFPARTRAEPAYPATGDWVCQFCPWPWGWRGQLDIGPGFVSDTAARFGDYRGLDERGGFAALDGTARYLDADGYFVDMEATNLALDGREVHLRGGRQGRYRLALDWQEIPRYQGVGTATPFAGSGRQLLSLPPHWVPAETTAGMTALPDASQALPLQSERRTLAAGMAWRVSSRWSVDADASRTDKDGERAFGGGVFTLNSSHFAAPVDYTTNRLQMGLSYRGERGQLRAGLSGSWFDNDATQVTWQNPFTAIPGTETLRAALAPDNQAWLFSLHGAWVARNGVRLSGRAGLGRAQQDDVFLPYSSNPDYATLPLPRRSLDGQVDTLNLAGKINARLGRRLDLVASAKLDQRDNRTAIDEYTPVITDLALREATRNRPYDFEKQALSLEARYRFTSGVRLRAGGRHEETERSLQAVEETTESTGWAELSFSPWSWAQLRLRLDHARRDRSPYVTPLDPGLPEHSLMRKFHLADRDRDRAVLELDLAPLDKLSLTLGYYRAHDQYSASPLGLQDSEDRTLSIDAAWAVRDNLSLHGFYTRDRINAQIAGAPFETAAAWQSLTRDQFNTAGAGLSARLDDDWVLRIDYISSTAAGDIRTADAGQQAAFPTLRTDLQNLRVQIRYLASTEWQWQLLAEHERYDSADWQIDGLGVTGIDHILTLGALSPAYSVTVVRLQARYSF